MADGGTTYKRCVCTDEHGKRLGARCPKLRRAGHGRWYFQFRLPDGRQSRNGGFATYAEAHAALGAMQAELSAEADRLDRDGLSRTADATLTTGQWLVHWLAEKERPGSLSEAGKKIAPTTARSYRAHLDLYLLPALGDIPLAELTREDVANLFRAVDAGTFTAGKPLSASSVRRLYATLRSALNIAVKRQHLDHNPALLIDLAAATRPRAMVWTEERTVQWQRTGLRPSRVMVWTPEQTGQFLDSVEDEPLSALFHLVALRGLRRGEAVGLTWSDVDFQAGTLLIHSQIVQVGWKTLRSLPKGGSERLIALDQGTLDALREHRRRQRELYEVLRLAPFGDAIFVQADGQPLHPDYVTRLFPRLVRASGLPPIRFHDLRHGAATLALASGAPMKVVQEMLGHSTIMLTADTYTSVLPQVARAAAESAAALVPRRGRLTAAAAPDEVIGRFAEQSRSAEA